MRYGRPFHVEIAGADCENQRRSKAICARQSACAEGQCGETFVRAQHSNTSHPFFGVRSGSWNPNPAPCLGSSAIVLE